MQGGLELAAHEGRGATAGNIVSFQQQGFAAATLERGRRSQAGITGANHHSIIMLHAILKIYR